MKTLLDYLEQYLKEEGLSSAIPDERKRSLFQSSSSLWKLLWISGTLAITIWMTWDFGGFWTGFNFGVGALWIFSIGHALWVMILKKKGQSSERSIYLIGRAFLTGYHLALLGFIFFLTVGWKGYYEETLVSAILFLLLYFLLRMASASHLVVLGWHSLQALCA